MNLDIGPSYLVLSDDKEIFDSKSDMEASLAQLTERLERYSGLFSALASMLYLPAFFVDQVPRIIETKFATRLYAESTRAMVKKARKVLGVDQVPSDVNEIIRTVEPPDVEFKSSGYWRPLAPGEIGEAKDGTNIVGKTWVQRTDSWSAQSLNSFVVSKRPRKVDGKDPGWIYIMRSGSHHADLYKIGLTRRSGEARASELSSATGVPTGFEVLAQWEVGDCTRVEGEIHKRLKHLRVNKRREFFRGNLK